MDDEIKFKPLQLCRVVIESPYKGDIPANLAYARRALSDSLSKGEAPIASHLLHTQVLNDGLTGERSMGIAAGIAWIPHAEVMAVYIDRGISLGMARAIEEAARCGVPIEYRIIGAESPTRNLVDELTNKTRRIE